MKAAAAADKPSTEQMLVDGLVGGLTNAGFEAGVLHEEKMQSNAALATQAVELRETELKLEELQQAADHLNDDWDANQEFREQLTQTLGMRTGNSDAAILEAIATLMNSAKQRVTMLNAYAGLVAALGIETDEEANHALLIADYLRQGNRDHIAGLKKAAKKAKKAEKSKSKKRGKKKIVKKKVVKKKSSSKKKASNKKKSSKSS